MPRSAPYWKVSNVQTYEMVRFRQRNFVIKLLGNIHCDVCSSVFSEPFDADDTDDEDCDFW